MLSELFSINSSYFLLIYFFLFKSLDQQLPASLSNNKTEIYLLALL